MYTSKILSYNVQRVMQCVHLYQRAPSKSDSKKNGCKKRAVTRREQRTPIQLYANSVSADDDTIV